MHGVLPNNNGSSNNSRKLRNGSNKSATVFTGANCKRSTTTTSARFTIRTDIANYASATDVGDGHAGTEKQGNRI